MWPATETRHGHWSATVTLLLAALATGRASPAPAQAVAETPVSVLFKFDHAAAKDKVRDADPALIEHEISRDLAAKLRADARLNLWKYQPANEQNLSYPLLKVVIRYDGGWKAWMTIQKGKDDPPRGDWPAELRRPADEDIDQPLPETASAWQEMVRHTVGGTLLSRHGDAIKTVLIADAPLARGLLIDVNEVTVAVMPLTWGDYKRLARSQFRIDCAIGQDPVYLLSTARLPEQPSRTPPEQRLVVRHQKHTRTPAATWDATVWEDIALLLPQLTNVRFGRIYLYRHVPYDPDEDTLVEPELAVVTNP